MKKLFFLLLIVSGCTKEIEQEQTAIVSDQKKSIDKQVRMNLPDQINFTEPGLYPESVEFDKFNNRFLVSSVGAGTIGAVSYQGDYIPFIQDADLQSTTGLEIDDARKRLLVLNTNLEGTFAQLRIYEIQTG